MGRSRDLADGTLSELNVDSNTLAVDATNNRVGIGTASPSTNLHVSRGSAGGGTWNGYTALAVESSNYSVISMKSPNANFSQILFGDVAGASNGQIAYMNSAQTNANSMQFYTNNAERMRIDSAGRVTMPYQPSFRIGLNTDTTFNLTYVVFNSTWHNTGNHYNTSTGLFTAPVAGVYTFSFSTLMRSLSDGTGALEPQFRINGGTARLFGRDYYRNTYTGDSGYKAHCGSIEIYMNVNDTFGLYSTNNVSYHGNTSWTNFSGCLIG